MPRPLKRPALSISKKKPKRLKRFRLEAGSKLTGKGRFRFYLRRMIITMLVRNATTAPIVMMPPN
jgi:hypothetical protein